MNSLQVHSFQVTKLMCTKLGVASLDKHTPTKKCTYRGNKQNKQGVALLDKHTCLEVYAFIDKCRVTLTEGCPQKLLLISV